MAKKTSIGYYRIVLIAFVDKMALRTEHANFSYNSLVLATALLVLVMNSSNSFQQNYISRCYRLTALDFRLLYVDNHLEFSYSDGCCWWCSPCLHLRVKRDKAA
jgi:hypothetical protein